MRSERPGDVLGDVFVFDLDITFAMRALAPTNGPIATPGELEDLPAASGRARRRLGLLEVGQVTLTEAEALFALSTSGMIIRKR